MGCGGAVRVVCLPLTVRRDSGSAGAVGVGDCAGAEYVSVGVGPCSLGRREDLDTKVLGQAVGEAVCRGVAADQADGGYAVPAGAAEEVAVLLGGEGSVADDGVAVGGDVGVSGEAVGVGGDSVGEIAHGGVAAVVGDAGGGLFGVVVVDFVEVDGGVGAHVRGCIGVCVGGGGYGAVDLGCGGRVSVCPGGDCGAGEVGSGDVGAEAMHVVGGEGGVVSWGEAQVGSDCVGEVGEGGGGVRVDGEVGRRWVGGGDYVDHEPVAEGELVTLVESEIRGCLGVVGDGVDGGGRGGGRACYRDGEAYDSDWLGEGVGVVGGLVGASGGWADLESLIIGGSDGA